jgi:hypothetical protein
MDANYGKRKDDIMLPDLTPEIAANLTDSQKINIKIIQSLNAINTALNDLQHQSTIFNRILISGDDGTGEISLQEKVRNLEKFVETFKFWQRTVATALVLQTVTFGAAAIIYFIKLTPILDKLSKIP